MITIISSAKSLDFTSPSPTTYFTKPFFHAESKYVLEMCQNLSIQELKNLMHISEDLAKLNHERFQSFDMQQQKQAIYAYNGDVFKNINCSAFNESQLNFLQEHLFIISGMYGLLRALDDIRPYRLEIVTKLPALNLYEFWQSKITQHLNQILDSHQEKYLINLASQEYSSVIDDKSFAHPIINIHFKEMRNGKLRTIALNAKKARGMMIHFIIAHKIDSPNRLKTFGSQNYLFNEALSSKSDFIFVKKGNVQ